MLCSVIVNFSKLQMKVKVHRQPLPPPLPFPKPPSVNNVSKYPHPPWEHISLLLPSDLQTYILKMRFHDTIADVRRHIDAVRYAVLKPETQTCETKREGDCLLSKFGDILSLTLDPSPGKFLNLRSNFIIAQSCLLLFIM